MTDSTNQPTTLERVLTALADLGPATAASIAEAVGIAYPTTTPKLRELESTGHAERVRTGQRTTLWRLTDTGRAAAASLAAGPTSTPTPPANNDPATGGSPPRTDLRPEREPGPGTPAPAEVPAPAGPPADHQHGDPTANTGQADPIPAGASGPVKAIEQVASQAEPDPEPTPEAEAEPTPDTDPAPSGNGRLQDQPSGQPHAEGRAGELGTDPPERVAHQAPPVPAPEPVDGRRKPAQPRRRKGELRDEVLALLRRNPGTAYKVGEICKLINQTHDGTDVNKASAGAVANALDKLVIAGTVTRLDSKVATYRAE